MLDPWIIEEIIRREREEKREERRIEMPLIPQRDREPISPAPAEDKDRGVVVIDI